MRYAEFAGTTRTKPHEMQLYCKRREYPILTDMIENIIGGAVSLAGGQPDNLLLTVEIRSCD